jgi:hypothetical protein
VTLELEIPRGTGQGKRHTSACATGHWLPSTNDALENGLTVSSARVLIRQGAEIEDRHLYAAVWLAIAWEEYDRVRRLFVGSDPECSLIIEESLCGEHIPP